MADTKDGFLDKAYDMGSVDEVRDFYGNWAETYEAEIAENGYATPGRCAAALAGFAPDKAAPILDIGCGTGLSGLAFRAAGFEKIDGTDLTPDMIEKARGKEGVYRNLFLGDMNEPLPVEPGTYAHMAAVGVMGPNLAPPETINEVLEKLPAGGCFVFSLNDHALAVPEYPGRVIDVVDGGAAELMFKEHGPHLPGIGLESTVFVLRKRY